MQDNRDPTYGKFHLITNKALAVLPNGPPASVVPSTNQGPPTIWNVNIVVRVRENQLLQHAIDQEKWLCDQAAEEACKEFIIFRIDEVYMKPLKNHRTGYKGVNLLQLLDHLTDTYPEDPEERDTIKKSITEPWDTTKHTGYLFNHITKGLETLADMQGNVTYTSE